MDSKNTLKARDVLKPRLPDILTDVPVVIQAAIDKNNIKSTKIQDNTRQVIYEAKIDPTSEDLQHVRIRAAKIKTIDRGSHYNITVEYEQNKVWSISVNPDKDHGVQMTIYKNNEPIVLDEHDIEDTFFKLKGMAVLHEIDGYERPKEHANDITQALKTAQEIMNGPSLG